MKTRRFWAWLLCLTMLLSAVPVSAAAYEDEEYYEIPVPVSTEGSTYRLFTEENLENQFGTTFLYVVKRDGRFYTPANPRFSDFAEVESVAAVDITAYWDAETNTFSGIPDSANVGVMEYQSYPNPGNYTSALYFDGDMMLSLSVPFEENGETWFGGIRYYDRHDTYSYSRALWEAKGDGSGYLYDRYTDWYGDDHTVYGVLALKGTDRFALRNFSAEFAAEQDIDVDAYLYAAPCAHPILDYSAYDAPTCMDKGCAEYWYCVYCDDYFADAECKTSYGYKPVLPALDHNYGDKGCSNCGQPTPVYTKITSYEQFRTIAPGASFIAVAELDDGNGGKDYYVLKKEIATTMADIDEDGAPDILLVDDNGNGVADVLEIDADGDGVADVMYYDGFHTGEPDGVLDSDEIWEYLFYLENEYTNGYMAPLRTVGAIPVTPAKDGTISVNGLGALEWIMERTIPDEKLDEQYYGDGATKKDYENDFRFRIPNFWIRPVVTVDNNYYQQPYDQGDSKWWGVLFGKDGKALNDQLYEPVFAEDFPDDAAVLYSEAFYSLNTDGELEHALRFLVNGEEKNFIMTSYFFWEEIEGTQYPIYLYCSDAGGEYHEHVFGDWFLASEETHRRNCTVEGCTEFEIASHTPGEGCEPDLENPELGHWVTCTECEGEYHEYHTRETTGGYYGKDYWRDTEDGVHHAVYCTKCGGPVEYAEHRWSNWYRGSMQIDGEWVMGHYRTCEKWPCEARVWQVECIYDEGTVTKEPTCTEGGIIEYVCTADDCACDTKYRTEELSPLGHDWGEWTATDDPTKEQRVCKNDAACVEYRDVILHEHSWSSWNSDGADTHSRTCSAVDCTVLTETRAHNWDDGVVTKTPTCTKSGVKTFTCIDCGATKTGDIEALGHDWSEWTDDGENAADTHSRTCRNGCGQTEQVAHSWSGWISGGESGHSKVCSICAGTRAEGHAWDDGKVTTEPTHLTEGVKTYTCGDCGQTRTETIAKTTDHEWSNWVDNGDGAHSRTCPCGETESENCAWDNGVVTKEPTHLAEGEKTYTCTVCGAERTEPMAKTDAHEWSSWGVAGNGTHTRFCPCGETESENCVYDDGTVIHQPTHTEKGTIEYCCLVCGHFYEEELPVLTDHAWGEWVVNKEDEKNTHIRFCVCDEFQTAPHGFDGGKVTVEPSHLAEGEKTYTCGDCGYAYTESIAKLADHIWGEWKPLDTVSGKHYRECACGEVETDDCTYDNGVVTVEPTHLVEGVKTYTCTVCGAERTESIAKLADHEWNNWVDGGDGTHARTCACGESEIAAHIWSEWTELAAGGYQRLCAVCGAAEKLIIDTPVNTTPDDNAAGTVLSDSDLALIDKILTDEEKSQIAQGAEVKIYLLVEDISDAVPADHKTEAEAKAGDDAIGMYLDLLLFKQVGNDDAVAVSETGDELVITITVPEELRNSDPAVKRTYKIVRVHEAADGSLVTDVIEGVFDAEDNSFTFATDKFSTYALAYVDSKVSSPVTGDGSLLWLLTAALFISVCGMAAVVYGKRRYSAK